MSSRSRSRVPAAAWLLVALLLLAACGDEGSADAGSDQDSAGEDVESPGDDAAADGPDDSEEEPEGADESFESVLGGRGQTPVAITYEGDESVGGAFEMTYVQDDPAFALLLAADDEEIRLIRTGDGGFLMCRSEHGDWECLRMDLFDEDAMPGMGAAAATPFLSGLEDLDVPGWDETSEATVAGRSATCASGSFAYGLDGAEVDGRSEICVDDETGALLRVSSESSDGLRSRVEAVEVGDPEPWHFEPPVEPTDLDLEGLGLDDFDIDDFDPEDFDLEDFDPEDFDS